jgi:hypothetical protein
MDTKIVAKRINDSIIDVIQEENAKEKITADSLDDILSAVVSGCARFMATAYLAAGYDDPVGMVGETFKDAAEQVEGIGGKK